MQKSTKTLYRLYVFKVGEPPDEYDGNNVEALIAKAERLNAVGFVTGWEIYELRKKPLLIAQN